MHQDIDDNVDKVILNHAINSKQVKNAMQNGLLSPKIINAFLEPYSLQHRPNETWYHRTLFPETTPSIKVKPGMVYFKDGYNFLISDYYLICYKGNNKPEDQIMVDYPDRRSEIYYKNKDTVYVIPLEQLDKFEIQFSEYKESYYNYIERADPSKAAFNGACFGMAIGGPAGAIIGANQFYNGAHDVVRNRVWRENTYNLIIEFINGDCIIVNNYWVTKGKENNKQSKMEKINEKIAILIEDSKKELTDAKKSRKIKTKKIVNAIFNIVWLIIMIICISIFFIY